MGELIPFVFEASPVRALDRAGEPWFIASDVAAILGYRGAPNMVRNLHDDEKDTHIVSTLGGNQELTIISESGLYNAIFRSRRPEAQAFRRWVTGTVLPEIRRTGRFSAAMTNDFAQQLERALQGQDSTTTAEVARMLSLSDDPHTRATIAYQLRGLGWQKGWVRVRAPLRVERR